MPKPVLMMQDGAIDELMSVALMTTMPPSEIDYLGCLVVNGDCLTPPTLKVTRKILKLLARLDPDLPTDSIVRPVGARAVNAFPWTYRQYSLMANLLPVLNPVPADLLPADWATPIEPAETLDVLAAAKQRCGEPVTILSLGPLTPLADLLAFDRETVLDVVGELVWMGGSLPPDGWTAGDAPFGNVDPGIAPGANPDAEWNAYWDPYAVADVFDSGMVVRMFPLNVTNLYPLGEEFFRNYVYPHHGAPLIDLAGEMYSTVAFEAGYCFWDTVTTASLGNADLFVFEPVPVRIETDYTSPDFGTITPTTEGGAVVHVAKQAPAATSPHAFYEYYVAQLVGVTA